MKMKGFILLCAVGALLCGCVKQTERAPFKMRGAWILTQELLPTGESIDYPIEGRTEMRIYSSDSVFYFCVMKSMKPEQELENIKNATDVIVTPAGRVDFTLVDMGHDGKAYFENGRPKPLTVLNDTTVVIQSMGVKGTWKKAYAMPQARIDEIKNIIIGAMGKERAQNFVLSSVERQLKTSNHVLLLLVIILVLFIALIGNIMVGVYRKKENLEMQMKQIKEEREQRPQPVRQVMQAVEEDFFCSDYYRALCKKVASGVMLREDDWNEIEERLKSVYPGFSNRLYGLCRMSELEYHVCLLIKLRIAPSEMASVLSKDVSTISTVRSRLYHKVFGKKGKSKDWDDFVNSL